jgi:hypothetical protein
MQTDPVPRDGALAREQVESVRDRVSRNTLLATMQDLRVFFTAVNEEAAHVGVEVSALRRC